jgi:pyruvate/2-oxoglutarate dehydrogenase complex dihydrolipoamide acyltransferase (E2) component
MPIAIKMPALSPTMEEGTLAKWLVKVGDKVSAGDIMAEIETDKATMEFEAVDEGVITAIEVAEGTEGVKVGAVIATLAGEDEDAATSNPKAEAKPAPAAVPPPAPIPAPVAAAPARAPAGDRIVASPLAKRIAADRGVDLTQVTGSGPHGRIVKADVEGAGATAPLVEAPAAAALSAPAAATPDFGIPYEAEKLNNVRKVIARRLTEAKQTAEAPRRTQQGARTRWRQTLGQRSDDQGAGQSFGAGAQVQCQFRRRRAAQVQSSRCVGRGRRAFGPDHADHSRCGGEGRGADLDRNGRARRQGARGQAAAA